MCERAASLAASAVTRIPPIPGIANSRPVASTPIPSDPSAIGPYSTTSWPNVRPNANPSPINSVAWVEPWIAFTPATIRDSKPGSVSTSPTLPDTCIRATRKAETRNVIPFNPIAIGAGPSRSRIADRPGPNASAKLSIVPASALAAARSRSGTTDGVSAVTAG